MAMLSGFPIPDLIWYYNIYTS